MYAQDGIPDGIPIISLYPDYITIWFKDICQGQQKVSRLTQPDPAVIRRKILAIFWGRNCGCRR